MKVAEANTLVLFDKYGLNRPDYCVVHANEDLQSLNSLGEKVVLKANVASGGKKKGGLVVVCMQDEIDGEIKKMLAKSTPEIPFTSVLVEKFIPHENEYFISLRTTRDGIEVAYSAQGGIEIESNWDKVAKMVLGFDVLFEGKNIEEELTQFFGGMSAIKDWFIDLLTFFQAVDANYLEINPFTLIDKTGHGVGENVVVPLGIVLNVDESSVFRHSEWEKMGIRNQESRVMTQREKKVAEIDAQIKGSIKLIEVEDVHRRQVENVHSKDSDEVNSRHVHSKHVHSSNDVSTVNCELNSTVNNHYSVNREPVSTVNSDSKRTALMAAGAGAALYLADAIIDGGLTLANYSEFSGNPPGFAITELTKQVCLLPGIKNLVIGSGIANFTPVVPNFQAIIEGFRQSPQAKSLHIVVRRCGPGEEEGIKLMQEFAKESGFDIQVFGRETGMTEIISKLKVKG